jgi:hypothetical protein
MTKAIRPYAAALRDYYKNCENKEFFYAPGARKLCRFKSMLYKRQRFEVRSVV